ncbi:unnamed protein product [Durusdinium trenchii]|uniref:Uncharacterized protein n=1 Tax=Durusdinium trenchii TaxID=1381693 RepID=A0ABP0P782_9DINO
MLAAHANRVTILDRVAKALKKLEGMSASSVCASSRSNTAFALMQSAFSFEELVLNPPTPQQIDDFWELYSMLLPTLRYTVWPDPATFDHIRRSYARTSGEGSPVML